MEKQSSSGHGATPSTKDAKSDPPHSEEWNWKTGFTHRMDNLLTTGFKSDLTIVMGENEFKVHKLILQIGSRVLNTRIAKCFSRLELEDCNADPEIFGMFLKYLYTGESGAQMEHALRLLKLATEFEVSELSVQCAKILKGDITTDNVIQLFNEAMLFAHRDLIRSTLDFICQNGEKVLALDSLKELRLDGLVEILQQDGLRVRREIDIFNAVYKWGEAQLTHQELDIDTSNMKRVLAKPLKYIRFPLMDPKDFGKVVAPKKLLDSEETISLLTSFLLPLEERGDIHGAFSSTSRTLYKDKQKKKVVVYRAGSSSAQVSPGGHPGDCSESLEFFASINGNITDIVLSEAVFDAWSSRGTKLKGYDYSGLSANVTINIVPKDVVLSVPIGKRHLLHQSESVHTRGRVLEHHILGRFKNLSLAHCPDLVNSSGAGTYGYLVATLPTPVEFPRDTWIEIRFNFEGMISGRYGVLVVEDYRYAAPYKGVFVDDNNPAIKFQFRRGTDNVRGPGIESGLIHHFNTILM